MTNLLTTHTHDYRWPTSNCLVPKAEIPSENCEVKPADCSKADKSWCQWNPPAKPTRTLPRECYDLVDTPGKRPWCERGPLVPLINPQAATGPVTLKVRPEGCPEGPQVPARSWCNGGPPVVTARVGAAPQQDTSRYDQPNQYLQKLCDKYPRPTAVVTATPRDELMRRVYADRYRTTYQADFCHNSDDQARLIGQCDTYDPDNKYTSKGNQGRMNGYVSQVEEEYVTCKCGCGCRVTMQRSLATQQSAGQGEPRIRPIACRPAAVSHNVHFSCCSPKKPLHSKVEEVGPPEKIPPWASEYSDSIGRTGKLIIEQKLHSQKPRKL